MEFKWNNSVPPYHDVLYLVRKGRDYGFMRWDSTSDCWSVLWHHGNTIYYSCPVHERQRMSDCLDDEEIYVPKVFRELPKSLCWALIPVHT